jgi:hypothetical protein
MKIRFFNTSLPWAGVNFGARILAFLHTDFQNTNRVIISGGLSGGANTISYMRRGDFVHFFRGKFRGKFSPQKCWGKVEFSAEKVLKNRFSMKFCGIFCGKKMYEKLAPGFLFGNNKPTVLS